MAGLEYWEMWKERCALALCTVDAQADLCGFAFNRFQRYWDVCGNGHTLSESARDIWHLFETHLALSHDRAGKSYKQWLFARGGDSPTLDCIQGGATFLMRDVARERARREQVPRWIVSADAPVKGHSEATGARPALVDLIPAGCPSTDEVADRELFELARTHADAALSGLSRRERLTLLAGRLDLSLAHPRLVEAAECGKSTLFNAHTKALHSLASYIRETFPDEPRDVQALLSIRMLEVVRELIFQQERLEKDVAHLFMLEGTGVNPHGIQGQDTLDRRK